MCRPLREVGGGVNEIKMRSGDGSVSLVSVAVWLCPLVVIATS